VATVPTVPIVPTVPAVVTGLHAVAAVVTGLDVVAAVVTGLDVVGLVPGVPGSADGSTIVSDLDASAAVVIARHRRGPGRLMMGTCGAVVVTRQGKGR
jgi:hypothetical protein